MGVDRSVRALVIAATAAAAAYAWTSEHGAPRAIEALAALGTDPLDARGGVVLDVRVAKDAGARAAAEALRVAERRLDSLGDVEREPRGDGEVRFTTIGAPAERADAIADGVMLGGKLELRPALEAGALVKRIGARDATDDDISVRQDVWPDEASGRQHAVSYLTSWNLPALQRAVAELGDDPDAEIVYERIEPTPGSPAPAGHWRTYVVPRATWILNDEIDDAAAERDPYTDKPIVRFTFNRDGRVRFGDLTAAQVGHKLLIMLDGRVWNAPVVNGPIRGGAAIVTVIPGDLARMQDAAIALATALRAGASMPAPVEAHVVKTAAPDRVRVTLARVLAALLAALAALAFAWALGRGAAISP